MNREAYLERMERSRQFNIFSVEPIWVPGAGDIDGFCHDEVVRQYHDPAVEGDGGKRIRWMRMAWDYAMEHFTESGDGRVPSVEDMLHIAALVEPEKNSHGFRRVNVWVGDEIKVDPAFVPEHVETLWQSISRVVPADGRTPYYRTAGFGGGYPTTDDFYLEFERIHPFEDGNGRTGKIIYNWLMGTLDQPVLVADYFGGGNP